MRRFIICNLLLVICHLTFAQTDFDAANAAYAEGRYEEAATIYQALIDEQPDATLYYNLGNARFKQGELAQAILNYERALRLQPNHKDAQYNLAFAQSKITDNIVEQDFFLSAWTRAVRNSLKEQTWFFLSVSLFVLALIGLLLFLLSRETWLRKTAFHVAWLAFLFSLIAGLNAASLHKRDTLRSEAIITQNADTARRFQAHVDAACVYWNAPTSFTDGAQFGLGAEIGISTQKLGPRGPMALEEITTYKWLIEGEGQIRA